MEELVLYTGGSMVVAFILVEILKGWIKNFISPRFGDLAVLLFLLIVSVILSLVGYAWGKLPADIIKPVATIFSGAIVIYQALYKAIFQKTLFGKLDKDDEDEK